jgi:2-phosphosulfolactate phosphatase
MIEVCFSPRLFKHIRTENECIVVVSDILRATTSICTALDHGAQEIIPVATLHEAHLFKQKGFLVAAERNGEKVDFADFGNSPFDFVVGKVKRQTLVYTTTNGTRAIEMAKERGTVAIGSFINRLALSNWLSKQNKDIVILCAGWKNQFNLEDALFCGALIESLIEKKPYSIECDSAYASLDLWSLAKSNLLQYIEKASHRKRLRAIGADDVLDYSFSLDLSRVVPVMKGDRILCV